MNSRYPQVERVLASQAALGEAAIWCAPEAALYWVDIIACELHRFEPGNGTDRRWPMPSEIGCCAPMDDGRVLVALASGFHIFDPESAALTMLARPADMPADSRFNDGTVDPAGRLIAGTMPRAGPGQTAQGRLYALQGKARIDCLERGLRTQNGLAFSPDGRTLYLSDSEPSVQAIWRYDYDPVGARCSHRTLFFDMRRASGRPDGAAMDTDGCYWSAAIDGWALLRITPDGRIDREIELPVQKPTKPAFGGPDLDTLFVTSLRVGLDEANPQHAEAGNLFAVNAGVTGVPVPCAAAKRLL